MTDAERPLRTASPRRRALGTVACALAAWGAWYGEIVFRFGWAGPGWLDGPDSPFVVCPLIAAGVIAALAPPVGRAAKLGFIGLAGLVFLSCYAVGGEALAELNGTGVPGPWTLARHIGALVVGWWFTSTGLMLCIRIFLLPIPVRSILATAVALPLVVPLSLASLAIYGHGGHGYVAAIKMGYPVLWTALLVPAASAVGWSWNKSEPLRS